MTRLICPICAAPLTEIDRGLACENRHNFDRAREGYVNLLPSGYGKSKLSGDSNEMVEARRRTLERGSFEQLSTAIESVARNAGVVLDVGCGEGYYLGRLEGERYGLDLSIPALKHAARAHRDVVFFANDVKHKICMADNSVDLLLNLFAPRNASEFARVLAPTGRVLIVIPGPQHLEPLRTQFGLLNVDADKEERTIDQLQPHFLLDRATPLTYTIELHGEALADLVSMTPSSWHLDQQTLAEIARAAPAPTTLDFVLLEFLSRPERDDTAG